MNKHFIYSKLRANSLKANTGIAIHGKTTYQILKRVDMLEYDEKRNYIRMSVDCELTYKLADASESHSGICTSISGSGVSFIADQSFDPGSAMEVNITPKNAITPPMTAYIEVVRTTKQDNGRYEIAAAIKSIKGH